MRSEGNKQLPSKVGSTDVSNFKTTRWMSFLLRSCLAYRTLEEERLLGWNSSELSMWYAFHRKEEHTHPDTNAASIASGEVIACPEKRMPPRVVGSSFASANIAYLADSYRKHCQNVLLPAAPNFFAPNRSDPRASEKSFTFLDLGCAPGGLSRFLLEDLAWKGVGLSLPPTASGIDVDPALFEGPHAARYALLAGDVCQPPRTWRLWTAVESTLSSSSSKEKSSAGVELVAARRFTFVNGGAVLDHGQRLERQKGEGEGVGLHARKRPREGDSPTVSEDALQNPSGGKKVVDSAHQATGEAPSVASTRVPEAILPWFTLFVPQLRLALDHVEKDGCGGIMLVYGAPQCASFFIILYVLEQILLRSVCLPQASSSRLLSNSPPDNIKILETIHPSKSPVYILLTKVRLEGRETSIERLMAALDPTSSTLYPMENSLLSVPACAKMAKHDVDPNGFLPEDPILCFEAKRRFWLGESDEGFAIAREAFQRYIPLISAVWQKSMRFLRRRRINAERHAAQSSNDT